MTRAVVILAALTFASCAPTRIWDLPETSGVLLSDTTPLSARRVWQVPAQGADACLAESGAALTDEFGRFRLSGASHIGLILLLPADSGHRWSLCAEAAPGEVLQWEPGGLSPPNAPPVAILTCRLSATELRCEAHYEYEP
jgi:hypothetical protein